MFKALKASCFAIKIGIILQARSAFLVACLAYAYYSCKLAYFVANHAEIVAFLIIITPQVAQCCDGIKSGLTVVTEQEHCILTVQNVGHRIFSTMKSFSSLSYIKPYSNNLI